MSSRITRQHTGGIISARMQYNNQLPGGGKDVLKSLEQACAYLFFSVCVCVCVCVLCVCVCARKGCIQELGAGMCVCVCV